MVVVIALVQDHADETILACGFGVLEGFEKEVMEDAHVVQDVIEEPVLDLNVVKILNICF